LEKPLTKLPTAGVVRQAHCLNVSRSYGCSCCCTTYQQTAVWDACMARPTRRVLVDGVSAPVFKTASTNLGVRTVLPRPQSCLLIFKEPVSLGRRFMDANVLRCGSHRLEKGSWYNRWAILPFPSAAPYARRISVISSQLYAAIALLKSLVHQCKQTHNRGVGAHVRLTSNVSRNQGLRFDAARPATWNCAQQSEIRNYRQRQRHRDGFKSYRVNGNSSACISAMRRRRQLRLIFRSIPWNHLQALEFCLWNLNTLCIYLLEVYVLVLIYCLGCYFILFLLWKWICQLQWAIGVRRGSWLLEPLEFQFRIPLEAWMFHRVFCVVLSCVDWGLATGWSAVQSVLPNV
jgi:hypothetical protein